jgi:hypothetical protein
MKVLNVELNLLELVIIAWCPVKFASIQSFVNVLLVIQECDENEYLDLAGCVTL